MVTLGFKMSNWMAFEKATTNKIWCLPWLLYIQYSILFIWGILHLIWHALLSIERQIHGYTRESIILCTIKIHCILKMVYS